MEKQVACPLCNGASFLKFKDMSLFGGKFVLNNTPYYKCEKCGEEFASSEQMYLLSNLVLAKRQEFFFSRPIINAGRSLAITIPSDIVSAYSLKKGRIISIIPESKDRLILKLS